MSATHNRSGSSEAKFLSTRSGAACWSAIRYDNALAESFVATLKTELLYRNAWPTRQATRTAVFEYIEGFYNTRRRHSALGYLSPAEFEEVRLGEEHVA